MIFRSEKRERFIRKKRPLKFINPGGGKEKRVLKLGHGKRRKMNLRAIPRGLKSRCKGQGRWNFWGVTVELGKWT